MLFWAIDGAIAPTSTALAIPISTPEHTNVVRRQREAERPQQQGFFFLIAVSSENEFERPVCWMVGKAGSDSVKMRFASAARR